MTDLIHKAFAYALLVQSKVAIAVVVTLKSVRFAAFDSRHYKDVPLARIDYGSDFLLHGGTVKAGLIPDSLRITQPRGLVRHIL